MAELNPRRYSVTSTALAAAFKTADVTPLPSMRFPAPAANRKALAAAGMLAEDGALAPEALAAVSTMAQPYRLIRVAAMGGQIDTVLGTELATSRQYQGVTSWAEHDAGFDIVYLSSLMQALLLVDEMARITDLPCERSSVDTVEFDAAAYVALLAAADHLQAAMLEDRMARKTTLTAPVCSVDDLRNQLERGAATNSGRWAVSAGLSGIETAAKAFLESLDAGIPSLESAGLLDSRASGYALTDRGVSFALPLTQLVATTTLSAMAFEGEHRLALSPATVFRTLTEVLVALWSFDDPTSPVVLTFSDQTAALGLVRDLLEYPAPETEGAPPPPAFCTSCGSDYPNETDRFCSNCGLPR
jgi:hypothetical protein